jgi:DNA-binding transcriptional MerR regulator
MENGKNNKIHQLFEKLEIGIGGVSSSLGVSQRQLRYWEQKGYIKPIDEKSGVRHYSLATVYLIAFIKDQLDAGFTLDAAVKKSKEVRIKSKIARKLLRSAFDDIEVTDEEKGYGKIKMGEMEVGDKRAEVFGIVDKNGSHFELKKEV